MARAFESAAARARSREALRDAETILIGLDFDGTLAPIVARPEDARVPARALAAVRRAAASRGVRILVLSARPLRDLKRLLPVRRVLRWGQYGLEGPAAPTALARARIRRDCRALAARLREAASSVDGALVEAKGMSVAVHDRGVAPARLPRLRRAVRRVEPAARRAGFRAIPGARALDFVPRGFEKGGALRRAIARYRPGRVFYFGDSGGDEPAFAALGGRDFAVRVGGGPTRAAYRVRDPRGVIRFLDEVARVRGD